MSEEKEFDLDKYLLSERELFLYDKVYNKSCEKLMKELIALDKKEVKPIKLHINSGGGTVSDGFGLINTMRTIKSDVITIAQSQVCSMATMIYIAGNKRWAYDNSVFMFHDMASGIIDYSAKIEDRANFLKKNWQLLLKHMKKYTKLTNDQIIQSRHGELWIVGKEAKKMGIVDRFLRT